MPETPTMKCSPRCVKVTSEPLVIEHAGDCRAALFVFNTQVNTRQVRRYYARVMAKRNGR